MRRTVASWLGLVPYREAWQRQRDAVEALKAGRGEEQLWLLEHPPVITLGRGAKAEHVLAAGDIDVVETDRGGDVTYHGPGQLVGYPLLDLRPDRCDVGRLMRDLERVMIETLAHWGIEAGRKPGLTGVWVGEEKIGAQGVRLSRWCTSHGIALNVRPNLAHFDRIVPCGIRDHGVTSMARLLGTSTPSVEAVAVVFRERFGPVFDKRDSRIGRESRMSRSETPSAPRPGWIRVRFRAGENYLRLQKLVNDKKLHTVCQEARCPNIYECWEHGTGTFMIMGGVCTRACGFCAVGKGRPTTLDADEPLHVAEAVRDMGLNYAVVTSVDRDDLPDYGAEHFAATIRKIREVNPGCHIEVLIPDFNGSEAALAAIMEAKPDVLNHNTETVPRLYRTVRPKALYEQTLLLLKRAAAWRTALTKSGIMLGLGETREEISQVLQDLRQVEVDILTVGQYLRPSMKQLPVVKYYHPDEFDDIRAEAQALGFRHCEAGPLVRSSYHAHEQTAGAAL